LINEAYSLSYKRAFLQNGVRKRDEKLSEISYARKVVRNFGTDGKP
jgi:hypothetical protein